MFLSFRKNKETKFISVQISKKKKKKKKLKSHRFIVKNVLIKNICDVVEIAKNS